MQQGISGYLGGSLAAGCGSCTPTAEPAVLFPRVGCLLSDYLDLPKQASPGGSACGKGFV